MPGALRAELSLSVLTTNLTVSITKFQALRKRDSDIEALVLIGVTVVLAIVIAIVVIMMVEFWLGLWLCSLSKDLFSLPVFGSYFWFSVPGIEF